MFPPLVASFPQAHLLPPHSLRPRASRPPATFKYMADEENEEAEDVPEEKMQQEDETMGAEKEEEMPED